MKTVRDILLEDLMRLGAAAELCDGNERAVEKALQRVQITRRDLAEVEARLRTILRAGLTP